MALILLLFGQPAEFWASILPRDALSVQANAHLAETSWPRPASSTKSKPAVTPFDDDAFE
jgi:hypothetical protein